jgi:regulator of sigma E protease
MDDPTPTRDDTTRDHPRRDDSTPPERKRRRSFDPEAAGASGDDGSRLSPWALLLAGAIVVAVATGHWAWVIAFLGLDLLVIIHEFGHFIAAKAFGMRVERFYVSFPPAAFRFRRGETEYGVGIIPLGGFCKISGMTPEEEAARKSASGGSSAPPDGASAGADAAVPVDTDENPDLRSYHRKPIWQRNIVILAGPAMNVVAAVVILFLFVLLSGIPKVTLTIGEVRAGTPAAAAGLKVGDRLVAADGAAFTSWDQATSFFLAHPRQTVDLTYVTPEGVKRDVQVTLTIKDGNASQGFLGVGPKIVSPRPPPWTAAWYGVKTTGSIVRDTFKGFGLLVTGKVSATGPDGVAGPVRIVDISQQAVRQSWYPLLLAFISLNLAIINLLPILPFDGGHVALNVLERVRRRRVDPRVLERVMAVGVVLIITLFLFLTINDIHHLGN